MNHAESITELLARTRAEGGADDDVVARLMPLVYDELRAIAHGQLRGERAQHTLSTTALVHEAYLRLVDQRRADWQDRSHFYAVAARVMRRVLVDYARRRGAHPALRQFAVGSTRCVRARGSRPDVGGARC